MMGARLDSETGWLAWGLNLGPEPRMVGTQALIGIKQTNSSFLGNTYNVTQYIKIGCNLLPTPIDLNTGSSLSIRSARRHQARVAHGILSIIGWGVILPIGVIIAWYFKKGPIHWNEHDQWKHAHRACQAFGYIFGATGWAIGLCLEIIPNITLFPNMELMTLALRLKPHKNDELHTYWSIYHLSLGYALLIVICVNIFKGIKILQEEETWKPTNIAIISSIAFIFFVFESSGDEWSAKQLKGDLESSASCTYDLQRKLVQAALASDSSGGVQSSFSFVKPCSAVFQYFEQKRDYTGI
ncbi:hypothetical protein RDI58_027244 [Solanum bulbocastanum]|uniref:Cytochrome b561 domain-containing protein n=1 Tax=Solanum bulbocastanum TaxID=147425 RepID=A0AAN8T225_SOLBU